jgi:hypothetical protein
LYWWTSSSSDQYHHLPLVDGLTDLPADKTLTNRKVEVGFFLSAASSMVYQPSLFPGKDEAGADSHICCIRNRLT